MQLEKIRFVSPKIPELVMQALISAIESGQIQVGEELPSERDLAEHLGVGRGSLRECLAILEFLGAIENSGSRKKVARDADYIRRAVSFGIPLADAVRAASWNPACALGMETRKGSLRPGQEAGAVLLDRETLETRAVIARGCVVEQ